MTYPTECPHDECPGHDAETGARWSFVGHENLSFITTMDESGELVNALACTLCSRLIPPLPEVPEALRFPWVEPGGMIPPNPGGVEEVEYQLRDSPKWRVRRHHRAETPFNPRNRYPASLAARDTILIETRAPNGKLWHYQDIAEQGMDYPIWELHKIAERRFAEETPCDDATS